MKSRILTAAKNSLMKLTFAFQCIPNDPCCRVCGMRILANEHEIKDTFCLNVSSFENK